jgi:hypothetical protein
LAETYQLGSLALQKLEKSVTEKSFASIDAFKGGFTIQVCGGELCTAEFEGFEQLPSVGTFDGPIGIYRIWQVVLCKKKFVRPRASAVVGIATGLLAKQHDVVFAVEGHKVGLPKLLDHIMDEV